MVKTILYKGNKILKFTALIVYFSVIISPTVSAYTQAGNIPSDEIWSGTIEVTGNVIVPQTVTLTIEPGTEILFADDTGLYIDGKLTATGTSAEPITFSSSSTTPTRTPSSWSTWSGRSWAR